MGKISSCALCENEDELKLSHIIPKFVFRFLKKDSFTGRMRVMVNPDVPLQDGDKQYLLCGECEKLFNKNETIFSRKFYIPFKNDGFSRLNYDGNWLNHFITSVNWRILYLDIIGFEENLSSENSISPQQLTTLKESEVIMRAYLLGKRRDIDFIENHIFFFDTIEKVDDSLKEIRLHSLVQGSVFGYTCLTKDNAIYTFANLAGAFIVTIIKKHKKDTWKNTFVKNEAGKIKSPQRVASPVFSELLYIAERRDEGFNSMSSKQREQLVDKVKKNPEKFKQSGSYQRWRKDQQIN